MAKSRPRWFTRLAFWLVSTSLLAILILVAIWFAASGLLARKAAHRATAAGGALQIDHQPLNAPTQLFETNTASHHITQRQIRMAFRGAAATLEQELARAPVVTKIPEAGRVHLAAIWEFSNGYVELTTGSGAEGDFVELRATPGTRPVPPDCSPATLDDLTSVYNP